jgi:hypothetical protein
MIAMKTKGLRDAIEPVRNDGQKVKVFLEMYMKTKG